MKNEKDWNIILKAIFEKQTSIIGLKLWECLATYFIVSFNCLNTISLWHKMDINHIHHSANKICLSVRLFQIEAHLCGFFTVICNSRWQGPRGPLFIKTVILFQS